MQFQYKNNSKTIYKQVFDNYFNFKLKIKNNYANFLNFVHNLKTPICLLLFDE